MIIQQCRIHGCCPECGWPINDVSDDSLINKTNKELHALECPSCGWETVVEVQKAGAYDSDE